MNHRMTRQLSLSSLKSGTELAAHAIAEAAQFVRNSYPQARGLILTGSSARGEATIALTPSRVYWLSDLEFLVVVGNSASIRQEGHTLDRLSMKVSRRLQASNVSVAVELTPAPERYFASIRPHLFGYELLKCGRQLYGVEDYIGRIPHFNWTEIPREDAWRLISNRIVEWLDYLLGSGRLLLPRQFYSLVKLYQDLLTSLCLFSGHYAPGYQARAAALEDVVVWAEQNRIGIDPTLFRQAVRTTIEFKLDPCSGFEWLWQSDATDLQAALREAGRARLHDALPATAGAVWRWQAVQIARASSRHHRSAWSEVRRIYGWRDRIRGWGKLLLLAQRRSKANAFGRMVRLFFQGTPRSLIYACAVRLLETSTSHHPGTLHWVRRHLPLTIGDCHDWNKLGKQCVSAWKTFLRRGYA